MADIRLIPDTQRTQFVIGNIPLDREGFRLPIPTNGAKGLIIEVRSEIGTWSNATFEVKKGEAYSSRTTSYSSPKTIAAGGARVEFSEADLTGIEVLEFVRTNTAHDSGATAELRITSQITVQALTGQPFTELPDSPA